jgi:hypothetical protein
VDPSIRLQNSSVRYCRIINPRRMNKVKRLQLLNSALSDVTSSLLSVDAGDGEYNTLKSKREYIEDQIYALNNPMEADELYTWDEIKNMADDKILPCLPLFGLRETDDIKNNKLRIYNILSFNGLTTSFTRPKTSSSSRSSRSPGSSRSSGVSSSSRSSGTSGTSGSSGSSRSSDRTSSVDTSKTTKQTTDQTTREPGKTEIRVSRTISNIGCQDLEPFLEHTFDISELICASVRGDYTIEDFLSTEPKCYNISNKIASNLIRVAATRIFSDPYKSIMEPVVNSVDAIRAKLNIQQKSIGKFGMGFFSLLYWVLNRPGTNLKISSSSREGDKICHWEAVISKGNKDNLLCTVKKYEIKNSEGDPRNPDKKPTEDQTSTVVEINSKWADNDLMEFSKHLFKLNEIKDVNIVLLKENGLSRDKSSYTAYYLTDYHTEIHGGYGRKTIEDRTDPKLVYVFLERNSIKIIDRGVGIPSNVLFNSLLLPSVSTKKVAVSDINPNDDDYKAEVYYYPSDDKYLVDRGLYIYVADVEIVHIKMDSPVMIKLFFPINTRLPVARDDIIFDKQTSVMFERCVMKAVNIILDGTYKTVRSKVEPRVPNLNDVVDSLEKYHEYNKQEKFKSVLSNVMKNISQLENVILIPFDSSKYDFNPLFSYMTKVSQTKYKLALYKYSSYIDFEYLLDDIFANEIDENIFQCKKVLYLENLNELYVTYNLPSYVFIDKKFKGDPKSIASIQALSSGVIKPKIIAPQNVPRYKWGSVTSSESRKLDELFHNMMQMKSIYNRNPYSCFFDAEDDEYVFIFDKTVDKKFLMKYLVDLYIFLSNYKPDNSKYSSSIYIEKIAQRDSPFFSDRQSEFAITMQMKSFKEKSSLYQLLLEDNGDTFDLVLECCYLSYDRESMLYPYIFNRLTLDGQCSMFNNDNRFLNMYVTSRSWRDLVETINKKSGEPQNINVTHGEIQYCNELIEFFLINKSRSSSRDVPRDSSRGENVGTRGENVGTRGENVGARRHSSLKITIIERIYCLMTLQYIMLYYRKKFIYVMKNNMLKEIVQLLLDELRKTFTPQYLKYVLYNISLHDNRNTMTEFIYTNVLKSMIDLCKNYVNYKDNTLKVITVLDITPDKNYHFTTKDMISTSFQQTISFPDVSQGVSQGTREDVSQGSSMEWMEQITSHDMDSFRLQTIEIAVNEGTTKNYIEAVMTEMLQNSIDAIRQTLAGSSISRDRMDKLKRIEINIGQMNNYFTVQMKDYVGMNEKNIFSLLIPFLSTKSAADMASTGEMGSGFFNVFRYPWCQEVIIQTSDGDKFYSISALPRKEKRGDTYKVIDIDYDISVSESHVGPTTGSGGHSTSGSRGHSRGEERSTTITVMMNLDMNETLLFMVKSNIFSRHKAAAIDDINVYINDELVKIEKKLIIETPVGKAYMVPFYIESSLQTNGVPFSSLVDYVTPLNFLDQSIIDDISSGLVINIDKKYYKPVQARNKLVTDVVTEYKTIVFLLKVIHIYVTCKILENHKEFNRYFYNYRTEAEVDQVKPNWVQRTMNDIVYRRYDNPQYVNYMNFEYHPRFYNLQPRFYYMSLPIFAKVVGTGTQRKDVSPTISMEEIIRTLIANKKRIVKDKDSDLFDPKKIMKQLEVFYCPDEGATDAYKNIIVEWFSSKKSGIDDKPEEGVKVKDRTKPRVEKDLTGNCKKIMNSYIEHFWNIGKSLKLKDKNDKYFFSVGKPNCKSVNDGAHYKPSNNTIYISDEEADKLSLIELNVPNVSVLIDKVCRENSDMFSITGRSGTIVHELCHAWGHTSHDGGHDSFKIKNSDTEKVYTFEDGAMHMAKLITAKNLWNNIHSDVSRR